jgi:N-acetylglucosamine-6-phosphate deacetylase
MAPTYIDLQVNGHGGIDLLSAKNTEEVRKVSRSLYSSGVIGYLPTIITSALSDAVRAIKLIEDVRKNPLPGEAKILGIHLEGPFISIEKRGVHPAEHIAKPDLNHLKSLLAAGLIKIVTIAPELPGAIELIQYLVANNIVVSLGHTNANREEATAGFNAGAKTVTHLFNAMPKPPLDGTARSQLNEVISQFR